jgi:hypothetical protein
MPPADDATTIPPDGDDPTHPEADVVPPDATPDAPSQIETTGLIQDLDADVGAMGSPVNAWINQAPAGGDNLAASTGSVQVIENAVNGHAALRFENNSRLVGNNTNEFCGLTSGAGLTWFAVVFPRAQDNPLKNIFFGTIKDGAPFSGFTAGVNMNDARPYSMMRPVTAEVFAQSNVGVSGAWVILAGRLDDGPGMRAGELFVNSSTASDTEMSLIPKTSDCGALVVGAERATGTEFVNADIARILIYDRPLTDAELAATGQALAERYAITTTF